MTDVVYAPHVLIIEDEALIALFTSEMLEERGYRVIGIASTGQAALALAAEVAPSLAVIDIRLPGGMDGVEVATVLKARYNTRLIFISGTLDRETMKRIDVLEPIACMRKPIMPAHFDAVIASR